MPSRVIRTLRAPARLSIRARIARRSVVVVIVSPFPVALLMFSVPNHAILYSNPHASTQRQSIIRNASRAKHAKQNLYS